jgi:hypothetical protein
MIHSSIKQYPVGSNPAFMKTGHAKRVTGWVLAFAAFLALLPLGHGFGAEWPNPPSGQPEQMWSKVDYDPKLTDPFFSSQKWGHPDTARCFSTSFGSKHLVPFCEAKSLEKNRMDLFIHHSSPGHDDRLKIRIRNGMFTCQFWTLYRAGTGEGLRWTTKQQKLTLNKKAYRKGDVIKGRIDFECLDELINPKYPGRPPRTIMVYGVFKTIVE